MAEIQTKFLPYPEAREWGNSQGVWQIITPKDDDNFSHRSIHFGTKISSYKNGVLVREPEESLFICEVSSDFEVSERPPTLEEADSFLSSLKENLPEHPLTFKLEKILKEQNSSR